MRSSSFCSRVARDRVERAEGLVHQHQRRVGGEGAREPDALALSAGELRGVARAVVTCGQVDEVEQLVGALVDLRLVQPSRCGTVATFSATVMCGKSPTCWMT